MDEKTMVNDVLNTVKTDLKNYQTVISETENIGLRQTIQQIRNTSESFHYELFKVAETKGYYTSPAQATTAQIQALKTEFE